MGSKIKFFEKGREIGVRADLAFLRVRETDGCALLLRVPNLDVMTAHQIGLSDASDLDLLAFAAEQTRIVVTHDRRTMPNHAATRSPEAKVCGRCHHCFSSFAREPGD